MRGTDEDYIDLSLTLLSLSVALPYDANHPFRPSYIPLSSFIVPGGPPDNGQSVKKYNSSFIGPVFSTFGKLSRTEISLK